MAILKIDVFAVVAWNSSGTKIAVSNERYGTSDPGEFVEVINAKSDVIELQTTFEGSAQTTSTRVRQIEWIA